MNDGLKLNTFLCVTHDIWIDSRSSPIAARHDFLRAAAVARSAPIVPSPRRHSSLRHSEQFGAARRNLHVENMPNQATEPGCASASYNRRTLFRHHPDNQREHRHDYHQLEERTENASAIRLAMNPGVIAVAIGPIDPGSRYPDGPRHSAPADGDVGATAAESKTRPRFREVD